MITVKGAGDGPWVDILVLAMNGLSVNKLFLKMLFAYTRNFRLIFIDNGSTDGTTVWAENYLRGRTGHVFVANDHNAGCIGGRNQAYEIAKTLQPQAPLLCILDNDQIPQPNWLEKHLAAMAGGYDLVGVYAWKMSRNLYPIWPISNTRHPFFYVGCGGMLMQRNVPDTVGLFDPMFNPAYWEDPDFTFRVARAGFSVGWVPDAGLQHLGAVTTGQFKDKRLVIFNDSRNKFWNKWRGKKVPIFRMGDATQWVLFDEHGKLEACPLVEEATDGIEERGYGKR